VSSFRITGRGYPTESLRWGLAATEGAFSTFHVDSDGLGTYVTCVSENSKKWWVVVGPKDQGNPSSFANFKDVYKFYNGLAADTTALGDVQVEAVLLRPGINLYAHFALCSEGCSPILRYMRPNTPHAVLTTYASICNGGFFLSTSNLRSTCYGFLMTFSLSTLITNTGRTSECQCLFRNMLAYFYKCYTGGKPDDAGAINSISSLR
jgi:hypothetical protein